MRYPAIIFLAVCFAFACVKPKTKDPVPVLEFDSVTFESDSTSYLKIKYQDGDGDLFRNVASDGPNFIYLVYRLDETTGKMVRDSLAPFGAYKAQTVLQPADGYYKGKSIQGDITIPLVEFRSNKKYKVLQYECFMEDMKKHKSNVVTSPVYTVTF